jgi:hypothetical protein
MTDIIDQVGDGDKRCFIIKYAPDKQETFFVLSMMKQQLVGVKVCTSLPAAYEVIKAYI